MTPPGVHLQAKRPPPAAELSLKPVPTPIVAQKNPSIVTLSGSTAGVYPAYAARRQEMHSADEAAAGRAGSWLTWLVGACWGRRVEMNWVADWRTPTCNR